MMPRRLDVPWRKPDSSCVLLLAGADQLTYGNTITDLSGNNNHGTITGATWVRLSSGLWVVYFADNTQKITITDAASLDFGTNSFFIVIWVYKIDANGDLLGTSQSTTNGTWGFSFNSSTGMRMYWRDDDGNISYNQHTITNFDSKWCCYGLVVNHDDHKSYIYQNGVLQDSQAYPDMTFTSNQNLLLHDFPTRQWTPDIYYYALPRIMKGRIPYAGELENIYNQERHLFNI
jgi:hypothetical protein